MESKPFKIIVVGIGPGAKDYVLPVAIKAIDEAKVVVGGSRALREFSHEGQETFAIKADIKAVMDFIRKKIDYSDVVVLVSGDPGYYSLLSALRRNFSVNMLKVIPGLSSMQTAFAKVALPWQDASLLSFHGRVPSDEDLIYHSGRIIGMLTDTKFTSAKIAQYLLARGWAENSTVYICAKISYPDEKIIQLSLSQASQIEDTASCVMIVEG